MTTKPLITLLAIVAIVSATHATFGGNRPDLELPQSANAQQSENR